MKNQYFILLALLSFSMNMLAQNVEIHPVFDRSENQIKSVDTIPDFQEKENKIKLYGTIYESDGVTPAKNVILYIEQADVNGDFDLRELDDKTYVHHRAWVKTDANGQYTLFTFIPGNDRRYNQLQQLFPTILEPTKSVYDIESFLFDEDPLLTKLCRKRILKKSDPTRILKLSKSDNIYMVKKDIVLDQDKIALK
ncbi:MAG: hypothetical protein BM564_01325 [Bacteroidetes bacterium MedPE-SWsnd-G2]|nr:MAG: hypothetical protein BM564_01325 [Bacteroidetes bacterium MedPE-SWsnd-G2]